MDQDGFVELLMARLPEGLVMKNPGVGTSTVMWCDGKRICYKRGDSRLYIDLSELYNAYVQFRGRTVSTNDLKAMAPAVFDSSQDGHNCHCTFFFMALQQMGLVDQVCGEGRPGDPFGVSLPIDATYADLDVVAGRPRDSCFGAE